MQIMVLAGKHKLYRRIIWLLITAVFITAAVVFAQDEASGYTITSGGRTYVEATDRTTFVYVVSGTGTPPALSHFDVEIPVCEIPLEVIAFSPVEAVSFGQDPTTEVNGIKWDLPLDISESRSYSVTLAGNILEGEITVAVKSGNYFETRTISGPSCTTPAISIEKYVSIDGGTSYRESDSAPGIDAEIGSETYFHFVVTNTGNTELTDISLVDDAHELNDCTLPQRLAPQAFFECAIGPLPVEVGQHVSIAIATAHYEGMLVSAQDSAYYWGGDRPELQVFKFVTINDGATWIDANFPPGPQVDPGDNVAFRFVIFNTGNVALSEIILSDDGIDTAACDVPPILEPHGVHECIVGPKVAEAGQHSNTATVTATYATDEAPLVATDMAHYIGEDVATVEDLPVTVIIVGPVEAIRDNIIVIYGSEIALDPSDPLLLAIELGDVLRVEGDLGMDDAVTIRAAVVVIEHVDVFVGDSGDVWRDDSSCGNPPPPWAPAHGWRQRCDPNNTDRPGRGRN